MSISITSGHTSEFVQLPVDRVDDEHVRRLVAGRHRSTNERQGPTRLLGFSLLIDKILKLP